MISRWNHSHIVDGSRGVTCYVAAAAFLLLSPYAWSGPRVAPDDSVYVCTLPDLEAKALRSSHEVAAQRLEFRQSEADILTASLRPNPQVAVNGDILPLPGERFDPRSKQFGASLQLPLELGGKRNARIRNAEDASQVTRLQVSNTVRLVLLDVRTAFADLQAAYEQLDIAESDLAALARLVELNQTRYSAMQIAAPELWRSIVARQQAELQRDEARLAVQKANEALAVAVGWRQKFVPRDSISAEIHPTPPLDTLEARALRDRPDLRMARQTCTVAGSNLQLQEANGVIDVAVSADASVQQGINLAGLSLTVPLPFFNRNQGEREKAAIRLEESRRQLQQAELVVRTDVQSAYAEYMTRLSALQAYVAVGDTGILGRAAQTKDAAEAAYRNGTISLLEYLDAVRTYFDVERSYVSAVAGFNKSAAQLRSAIGADADLGD